MLACRARLFTTPLEPFAYFHFLSLCGQLGPSLDDFRDSTTPQRLGGSGRSGRSCPSGHSSLVALVALVALVSVVAVTALSALGVLSALSPLSFLGAFALGSLGALSSHLGAYLFGPAD